MLSPFCTNGMNISYHWCRTAHYLYCQVNCNFSNFDLMSFAGNLSKAGYKNIKAAIHHEQVEF